MIIALLGCAVYFTLRSRFVQFSMIGEMCRQLVNSTERHLDNGRKHISPFQAFVVSLASRVGTGNLAGVATAIAVMHISKTLHPPGGATALIAVTGGESIRLLGWAYAFVPCLSGALILLLVALVVNNIPRHQRWPLFW